MSSPRNDVKILVIGESGVGKTCLIRRFVHNEFPPNVCATIACDYFSTKLTIDDHEYTLLIWDTAGQERFRALTANFYRNGKGAILVYDVTNKKSFVNLKNWFHELDTWANEQYIVKMVVANKSDLSSQRQVSKDEGLHFAKLHKALYLETSAEDSSNVHYAFEQLMQKIHATPELWIEKPDPPIAIIRVAPEKRRNDCSCKAIDYIASWFR